MSLAEKIDICGLRALVLLAVWLIIGETGVALPAKIVSSFAAAMCLIGFIDSVWGRKETANEPRRRAPLLPRLKEIARAALTRKNARRFMIVSLILLVFSFFVGVSVWYYVMIAVNIALVCLCLASRT